MDEYKEYFYTREPLAANYDPGDLTSQLELRKSLNCKSFSWFMKNVAYDVLKNFPLLPRNLYWGEVCATTTFFFLVESTPLLCCFGFLEHAL